MATRLTKKEKGFAKDYLETGNATQSALKNYDTTSYSAAAVIGHENLNKPKIRQYLDSKAEKAAEMIFEISQNGENDNVKLAASKDILDRAGYKPIEKSVNLSVEKRISDEEAEKLANELLRLQKGNS